MKLSAEFYLGLLQSSKLDHRTISVIVEVALWKHLTKVTDSGEIIRRLLYANALVHDVVVTASALVT